MIDYEQYRNHAIESTPPTLKEWLGEERLRSGIEEEFRQTISARMESQQNAVRYSAMCPVQGATPTDYQLREIAVADDLSLLAGIHFRNLDLSFPFVGIFAQSRAVQPEEILPTSHHLAEEFNLFHPRSVRWWSAADQLDLRTITGTVGDQRMLVGSIPELIAQTPSPTTELAARIEPETEREGYDRYYETYTSFLEANPEWRGNLSLTDRETFKECEEANGLYRLMVAEEYAGVIAACPGRLMGVPGWEVIEEMITAPFRGKGLAPVMQRLFIEQLDTTTEQLIFGTINDRNTASMKTALRTGREDVGGWVFLSLS